MKHSRFMAAAVLTASLAAIGGGVASADRRHDDHPQQRVFTLRPDPAANPEGIAVGRNAFFVSDSGSGAIYKGSLSSNTVSPYIAGQTGGAATGLKVWRGKLYVAGAGTGKITVYDL